MSLINDNSFRRYRGAGAIIIWWFENVNNYIYYYQNHNRHLKKLSKKGWFSFKNNKFVSRHRTQYIKKSIYSKIYGTCIIDYTKKFKKWEFEYSLNIHMPFIKKKNGGY